MHQITSHSCSLNSTCQTQGPQIRSSLQPHAIWALRARKDVGRTISIQLHPLLSLLNTDDFCSLAFSATKTPMKRNIYAEEREFYVPGCCGTVHWQPRIKATLHSESSGERGACLLSVLADRSMWLSEEARASWLSCTVWTYDAAKKTKNKQKNNLNNLRKHRLRLSDIYSPRRRRTQVQWCFTDSCFSCKALATVMQGDIHCCATAHGDSIFSFIKGANEKSESQYG